MRVNVKKPPRIALTLTLPPRERGLHGRQLLACPVVIDRRYSVTRKFLCAA